MKTLLRPAASPARADIVGVDAPAGSVTRAALVDVAPILAGLVPFAGVIGVTMSAYDIPVVYGVVGSFVLWAGSAQLAILTLLGTGAGILPALLSVVLINSRFSMYGAALEPMFRGQPAWFRWLAPHFIVDQNYGLAAARHDLGDPSAFRRYWLVTSGAIGVVWLSVIGLAMNVGETIPADSPLTFSTVCIYVALLVPRLGDRSGRRAAATATVVALACSGLTTGVGILAGVVAGIAASAAMGGPRR